MKQINLPSLRTTMALGAVLATFVACSRAEDFREWRADDHTHAAGSVPVASGESAPSPPKPQPNLDDEVVDVWRLRCAKCHGPTGRGNGPEGPMYNTPSLVRPDWQAQVSDEMLRVVISRGRGRMPPAQLSRPMLDGMVRLVRSLGRRSPSTAAMPPGHPPVGGARRVVPADPSAQPGVAVEPRPSAASASASPAPSAK